MPSIFFFYQILKNPGGEHAIRQFRFAWPYINQLNALKKDRKYRIQMEYKNWHVGPVLDKNEPVLKIEVNFKNEYKHNTNDNLKKEDNIENEDNLKNIV